MLTLGRRSPSSRLNVHFKIFFAFIFCNLFKRRKVEISALSLMMMMIMMMSRFIERVINGPQTRCRSAEQVGLQMSSERQGERVVVRRVAGKLFRMTGPATAKLLIPSVVLVLGTDNNPVPAKFLLYCTLKLLIGCQEGHLPCKNLSHLSPEVLL